jgi:uncharacterized tellurite resistance protein B-like protein
MACDGDIDKRELLLIKSMHHDHKVFGDLDIEKELDELLLSINHNGKEFLKSFFNDLSNNHLTKEEELKLIEAAIDTFKADEKVEYSEIKFFKVIRSKLKIQNELILEIHPDFEEYLEQDVISDSYLSRLQDDFFDTHTSTKLELITVLDENVFKNLKSDTDLEE